jgi:hypothetical protein
VTFAKKNVIDATSRFGKGAGKRRGKLGKRELRELFEKDLARSGIDVVTAEKVGFEPLGCEALWKRLNPKRPSNEEREDYGFTARGYSIRFFDAYGKPINFVRARRLGVGKWKYDDDGTQRYTQPRNTIPHLYIPHPIMANLPSPDPKTGKIKIVGEFLIVEGEKKAVKANMCGILAVALAGVWNYTSAKHAIMLIDELKTCFDLSQADVVLCFDVDVYGNSKVDAAIHQCAHIIRRDMRPKSVKQVRLTHEAISDKIALDDWLAKFQDPPTARMAWLNLRRIDDPTAEAFATFNAEICHVALKKLYFDIKNRVFYPAQSRIVEQYGIGALVLPDGGKAKAVHPVKLWLTERPPTTSVLDVVYAPGKDERFKAHPDDDYETLNMWRDTDLQPIPFDSKKKTDRDGIKPFLEYIEHISPHLTDEQRHILLCWLAYQVQHIGSKLDFYVCLLAEAHGTGKGTMYRIMREILGSGASRTDNGNTRMLRGSTFVNAKYNDYALCQLLFIDEIHVSSRMDRAAAAEDLKTLVTEDQIDLNRKFLPHENVTSYVNVLVATNHYDAIPLEPDDRRAFVIEGCGRDEKWTEKQWDAFNAWLAGDDNREGYARIFGYLLAYDLKKFNPHMHAPITAARNRMVSSQDSAADDLIRQLVESPDSVLSVPGKGGRPDVQLFPPRHIVECLNRYARENNINVGITAQRFGALMRKHAPDLPHRTFRGKYAGGTETNITVYALFDSAAWGKRKKAEWAEYWRTNWSKRGLKRR